VVRASSRRELFPRHVTIVLGRAATVPVATLGTLFAALGHAAGISVPASAAVGAFGGAASLLIHELGHALAARRTHAQPRSIALTWLGAATRLDGKYATGREQARVAIAGPAASFTLAVALGSWAAALPLSREARLLALLLAALNAVIAILNLAPVSPLDGYKLVVGLVWMVRGSEAAARRIVDRFVAGWALVEVLGALALAVEKPVLGLTVATLTGCMLVQKAIVAHAHH
jgi:Zn-dependent protease